MDNITNLEQDFTIPVISRASLAQRARGQREGFTPGRARVLSKVSLAQRPRGEREGFAKRARLEHDTTPQAPPLRRPSVDILIRDDIDLNAISTPRVLPLGGPVLTLLFVKV